MSDKKTKDGVVKSTSTIKQNSWTTTHTKDSNVRHKNCCLSMITEHKVPTYKKEAVPSGKKDQNTIFVAPPMGRKK